MFLNGKLNHARLIYAAPIELHTLLLNQRAAEKSINIFLPTLTLVVLSFSGELEAARATNVNLYIAQKIKAQSKKKKAPPNQKRVGLLIITNFRLCFVVFDEHDKTDKSSSNKVNFFPLV